MAVNVDAKDIVSTFKSIPYKLICSVVIAVTGVLVFLPTQFIDFLGLGSICSTYRPYLSILLIVSFCILIVGSFNEWLHRCLWRASFKGKNAKKKLDALSPVAQGIVRKMYESEGRTMLLPITNGVVSYLRKTFVIQSAPISMSGGNFDFYLQPWVVTYLAENPDYLAQLPQIEEDDEEDFR